MNHPFQNLDFKIASWLLLFLILLSIGIYLLVLGKGNSLIIENYPVTKYGILSLELAYNEQLTREIIRAWKTENVLNNAIALQWIDFLFLITYSTALSLGCIWSTLLLTNFNVNWTRAGVVLAWLQWVAGGFDIVENLALFPALMEKENLGYLPKIATICAGFKFILIIIGIFYILAFLVLTIFNFKYSIFYQKKKS